MAKILIVEDDLSIISMVKDWLEHQNHLAETAHDGKEAREKLLLCSYDVIVLDWSLPHSTGIELLKEFRERGGQTPVLMLTAKGEVPQKEQAFDAGVDDYLTKPFHIRELGMRVSALLRRPAIVYGKTFHLPNDIKVDTSSHTVTRGGEDVHLRAKEYALLEFFLLHPNQIFSAEALLERIWESGSESTVNALIVCIKRLREKLDEEDGDKSIISTVRGSGYILKLPQT